MGRASQVVQWEMLANAGGAGSVPGVAGIPGGGNDNPLQYSCLQNPMYRGSRQAIVQGGHRVRYNLVTKPQHMNKFFFITDQNSSLP